MHLILAKNIKNQYTHVHIHAMVIRSAMLSETIVRNFIRIG